MTKFRTRKKDKRVFAVNSRQMKLFEEPAMKVVKVVKEKPKEVERPSGEEPQYILTSKKPGTLSFRNRKILGAIKLGNTTATYLAKLRDCPGSTVELQLKFLHKE